LGHGAGLLEEGAQGALVGRAGGGGVVVGEAAVAVDAQPRRLVLPEAAFVVYVEERLPTFGTQGVGHVGDFLLALGAAGVAQTPAFAELAPAKAGGQASRAMAPARRFSARR